MPTISSICSRICSGGTPKSTESSYYGGTIPWLNTKEIDFNVIESTEKTITEDGLNNSSAKWIEAPCVIVAMYGATAGKVAISNIRLTTNQACCNLNIDSGKADYRFVYYALKNDFTRLSSMANGGAQQNLNAQQIKDFDIPDFSLSEQKKIAAILSSLDEKIETNRKINARLEELAQALFKSWFIDFEPFGGQMPEDWEIGILSDIADISSGKRPIDKATACSFFKSYPIVGASSIMGYTSKYLYNEPVLVIGRVGTLGVVQRWKEECWLSDNTLIIKSKYYAFVYNILKHIDYNSLNRGSTQPLITQSDIKQIELIIPTLGILKEFEDKVASIFDQEYILEKESARLAALRDTLLPKLMSGELKPE